MMELLLLQVHASKSATLGGGGGSGPGSNIALIASLKQSLSHAMQQNSMMRARLQKIHIDSDVSDVPSVREWKERKREGQKEASLFAVV